MSAYANLRIFAVAIYDPDVRKIGLELLLFVIASILVALVCGIGLVGGITDTEAFVPVYLVGLIFAVVAIAMYAVSTLFRTVCWLVSRVR